MKWKIKNEASGHGQANYMHTIRVDGDYDMDRGKQKKIAKTWNMILQAGLMNSNEMMQGGVNIPQ